MNPAFPTHSNLACFLANALMAGCITDGKDSVGPRSLREGRYRNSELGHSFVYPETWKGGLLKNRHDEMVARWSPRPDSIGGSIAYVFECPVSRSPNICESFLSIDTAARITRLHQGVEVITGAVLDDSARRNERLYFRRGETWVMFVFLGFPDHAEAGSVFDAIDSSLTFF